jgi:hypothetical protein
MPAVLLPIASALTPLHRVGNMTAVGAGPMRHFVNCAINALNVIKCIGAMGEEQQQLLTNALNQTVVYVFFLL